MMISLPWLRILSLALIAWYSAVWLFKPKKTKRVLAILGSGGHTSEVLKLLEGFDGEICAVCADGDSLSKIRFIDKFGGRVWEIYRSRRVGQGYLSSIFTTFYSFWPAFWVILKERPEVIVTNGPGTALPLCYVAFFLRFLILERVKIMYVESFCRVSTLSLAGKLIYPISDEFYVQWESLHKSYPKTKYIGLLSY